MRILPLILGAVLALTACGHSGPYIWVHEYRDANAATQPAGYVIAPGDTIFVRVWNQESMSARVRVRDDGKISLPFLNDVIAARLTPDVLSAQLQKQLKDYINNPVVTVSLEESRAFAIPVLGQVTTPGSYTISTTAGVLGAIAAAGGLNEFAHKDAIFVVRKYPSAVRIRFSFDSLSQGEPRAVGFQLRDGDVVVVE